MNRKKVLIDLRNISNPTNGFGQIAINYARVFGKLALPDIRFLFLMPENYNLPFHVNAELVRYTKDMRHNKSLLPEVQLWHSVNQQQKVRRLNQNTKFVLTIHDLNYIAEKSWIRCLKHDFVLKRMIRRADAVTAISGFVAEQVGHRFEKVLGKKKVEVVYDAVERIDLNPSERPDFAEDKPFFFTIGQIRMKKNFHLLLDVMRHFPEHNLYICGDDHFEAGKLISKKLAGGGYENVRLTGKISNEEKVWLYSHCDAFLFPSQGEGFGLPVIEAMQFGIPVFVSPFTCLPEISGGQAFIWKDVSIPTMVKGIKEYIPHFKSNPQLAENMRKHAFSFNYEKHVMKYVEIYRQMLQ